MRAIWGPVPSFVPFFGKLIKDPNLKMEWVARCRQRKRPSGVGIPEGRAFFASSRDTPQAAFDYGALISFSLRSSFPIRRLNLSTSSPCEFGFIDSVVPVQMGFASGSL